MVRQTTIIKNKTGLHARPASDFTRKATQYSSSIRLINLETHREGDAKSIISVMTMMFSQGSHIEIIAEGDDEEAAVQALIDLIDNGFGEL